LINSIIRERKQKKPGRLEKQPGNKEKKKV
jgi:hypothetical protein